MVLPHVVIYMPGSSFTENTNSLPDKKVFLQQEMFLNSIFRDPTTRHIYGDMRKASLINAPNFLQQGWTLDLEEKLTISVVVV